MALLIVVGVGWAYGEVTWRTADRARAIALSLEGKPFVYRALVPWLAQGLMRFGVSPEWALTVLVMLSAIGLFYGLQYLSESFGR